MTDKNERIEVDPEVMFGKPVIAGTRVTVESIFERLAAGESVEQILRAQPHLEEADIRAAFRYATGVLRNEDVYPTRGTGT